MSKYTIEYTIEAESAAQATAMAYENVYFAELEPEEIRVRPVSEPVGDPYKTFGELPKVGSDESIGTRFSEWRLFNADNDGVSRNETDQRRIDSFNEPG